MKKYKWRYDTKLFNTKKEALKAIGSKENWADVQSYYEAKRRIVKEYIK